MNELAINKQRGKLKDWCSKKPNFSYCHRWSSWPENFCRSSWIYWMYLKSVVISGLRQKGFAPRCTARKPRPAQPTPTDALPSPTEPRPTHCQCTAFCRIEARPTHCQCTANPNQCTASCRTKYSRRKANAKPTGQTETRPAHWGKTLPTHGQTD